jgi:peptide/nickel transport system permease protein
VLQAIPLLFIISLVLFLLMMNLGDPLATMGGRRMTRASDRERLTRQLGLDKPILTQYLYWLIGNDWDKLDLDGDGVEESPGTRTGVLRGDFGTSIVNRGKPVLEVIGDRLPNTLLLMVPAEIVIILGAMIVGIVSAIRQYSLLDHTITTISFLLYSMPIFFVALLSMYIFAVLFKRWGLPYLPTVGMFDPNVGKTNSQVLWHMVLPLFSIASISLAGYSRYIRSTMLEVMSQDYIRTAKSKGLPRKRVIMVHALKNASLPIVTIIGLDLPFLLAGALVTESIFAWPGMGRLFIDHLERSDTPVIMGILLLISVAVVIFQLLTDITYAWLDPRIRFD